MPSLTFVTGLVKHFFELGRMLHDEEVVSGQARASPARARAVRTFRDVLVGSVIIHWGIILASSLTHEGVDSFVTALKNAVVRHLEFSGGKDVEAIMRQAPIAVYAICLHFISLSSIIPLTSREKEGSVSFFSDSFHLIGNGHELAAEELRLAAQALGHLTGHLDVEELLDAAESDPDVTNYKL